MITLYRKNSFGIGRWCIWQDYNVLKFGNSATLDGSMNINEEVIHEGKANRSIQEQLESRMNSRVSKMRDKGYKDTMDEASQSNTNQLGLVTPMLAKPLKADKIGRSLVQPKINGHRCLITCIDDEIIAYSRQGKRITTIDHITSELKDKLPENVVIDGELYLHDEKLQNIASLVKRQQPKTKEIEYYVYDYIDLEDRDIKCEDRIQILQNMLNSVNGLVRFTPTVEIQNIHEAMDQFKIHMNEGYEGAMIRDPKGIYESGKRSSGLLKIKPLYDTEVEVIDIVPGDTGLGICVCRMEDLHLSFKTLAPGTHEEKIEALRNKDQYIGRRLKIEYRERTADGVPFHAAATEWYSNI